MSLILIVDESKVQKLEFRPENGKIKKIVLESPLSPRTVPSSLSDHVISRNLLPHHIDPNFLDIVVLDSVKSGKGRPKDPEQNLYTSVLVPLLNALKLEHQYVETKSAFSIHEFGAAITSNKKDLTVLILSGDTSIHEFVNLFSWKRTVHVGLVPMGSGNALALELGIETPTEGILRFFSSKSTKLSFPLYKAVFLEGSVGIDGLSVREMLFFVVFSWGLHAAIVGDSDTPEKRKLGNDRFKAAAMENIEDFLQSYRGTVSETSLENHAYFLIGLVKSLEKGFVISPRSDLVNGNAYLLDIPFFEGVTGTIAEKNQFLVDVLGKVYDGSKHIEENFVVYKKILEKNELILRIDEEEERKRRVCIDGRIVIVGSKEGDGEQWVKIEKSYREGLYLIY